MQLNMRLFLQSFTLSAIFNTMISFTLHAQTPDYRVGELVKEYAIRDSIYWPTSIISDNNISTVVSHNLPDIRCFNEKGEALRTLNCMASIVTFIDLVNDDKVEVDSAGESLEDYLEKNTILYLNGKPLSLKNLPRKKYYIFYSYTYNVESKVQLKDVQEAYRTLNKAYQKLNKSKAVFYNVCITGIAINNTKLVQ